jgi:hypothetical protein
MTIKATISGASSCTAEGITATGNAPVLALCRKLLDAGYDPNQPLDAYRANVLALKVRSIGAGAALTVEENRRGTKFATFRPWPDSPQPSAVEPAIRLAA